MGEVRGFNAVVDQVVRRRELEARRPDIEIVHTDCPWEWIGSWTDSDGAHVITRNDLEQLLDALSDALD